MPITLIKAKGVRNLTDIHLEPCTGLNLFYGENGSGKTSLLEAISILAHGRSFRTINYRQVIQHDLADLSVFAVVPTDNQPNALISKIGILRPQRGTSIFRVDGAPVYSSASLASLLPLQVMNAKSFDLLEGPSKVRRRMFDWLVFHVKHDFANLWRDYTKAVKQRNTLLRRDKISGSELHPWDLEINRLGVSIDALRQQCLVPFIEKVQQLLLDIGLPSNYNLAIEYQRGWSDDYESLTQALSATLERDKKYGYTTCGAHKSEIKVMVNKVLAADILSRGQQKSLVAAFLIAELQLFEQLTQRSSVLLIDDLPAELDQNHIKCLANWLQKLDTQIFVTGINSADMNILKEELHNKPCKVFHVKHGEINECNP
jgi:DNA replication and repair protein RecF